MSTQNTDYHVKLKNRFPVAERTMAFEIEKPPGFTFKPGQWLDITLPGLDAAAPGGNARGFSFASAPEDDLLMVATRMRDSAFKRAFGDLPLESEVRITMTGGSFTLHNNTERTAIFLAGGIGVTPMRSILRHAALKKLPHRIIFFFSNSTPENAPFLEELTALQKENPNYTFVPTMTHPDLSQSSWKGETGRVNKVMLEKYAGGAKSPIYYIVGPPAMVTGTQNMLEEAGCDSDDIRTEGFGGY